MKKQKLVSLKEIFEGIQPPRKLRPMNQTIKEQLEAVLEHLPPSKQLKELEKLSMEIRKKNSIRINQDVNNTRIKYPKIK
jgi:hypothetical protein